VSEAAELFEKALTIDGTYSSAWLGLAECARFAGDRKRALKLYLRTITENEWNYRAWLRGYTLLEELEFHDNAASWRRKVAVHFPEHPLADSLADTAETGRTTLQVSGQSP
jgi:tetratricopeptide (TPR) repeat protein